MSTSKHAVQPHDVTPRHADELVRLTGDELELLRPPGLSDAGWHRMTAAVERAVRSELESQP